MTNHKPIHRFHRFRLFLLFALTTFLIGLGGLGLTSCTLERPPIRPKRNINKDQPTYYDLLARKYYNREEYKRAIFQYQRILTIFSNQPARNKELAWAEYEIGYTYYKMGENDNAVKHLNKVVNEYGELAPRILAEEIINKISSGQ